jgi:HKD family nuclease
LSELSFLESTNLLEKAVELFRESDEIEIAVAYLKEAAYRKLRCEIVDFLTEGKKIKLLVGLASFCITDVEPLEDLLNIRKSLPRKNLLEIRYYSDSRFHPKLFIFKLPDRFCAIVGSSNLTTGGWGGNIEANILLCQQDETEAISDIKFFFDKIWKKGPRKLTEQVLSTYKRMKNKSLRWGAQRVSDAKLPKTKIQIDRKPIIDIESAYFLGCLLARGTVESNRVIFRIPCRRRDFRAAHESFLNNKFRQMLAVTSGEKAKFKAAYNPSTRSVEAAVESRYLLQIVRSLRIPKNCDLGRRGKIPKKILKSRTEVLRAFLRGYGDFCATVGTYFGYKARVTLNILYEGGAVIEGIVQALEKVVEIADVNLPTEYTTEAPPLGTLEQRLRAKHIASITRGSNTPQVRIWGDNYTDEIGFQNGFLDKKLREMLP